MLTVDDLKKELGISERFKPRHVQAIRTYPTIKKAIESGDLPRLRKMLGIPENGLGVRFLMKLSDLIKSQNRHLTDANKYSDAVLKSDAKGYAWGSWLYGEGEGTDTVSHASGHQAHLSKKVNKLETGQYMYTIDTNNELRYAIIPPEGVGTAYITHSQLLGGQSTNIFSQQQKKVWGAGEFAVVNGKIIHINTGSGHFKPTPEYLIYALAVFKTKGFDLQNVEVTSWPPISPLQEFRMMIMAMLKAALAKVRIEI